MRTPDDLPPRRRAQKRPRRRLSNRGRIALIVTFGVLVALFVSARGIAGFYTDYLWFDTLGYSDVFTGVLGAKVLLAIIFTAAFFALSFLSLTIADRLAPKGVRWPEDDFVARYQQVVGRRARLVRIGTSLVFALIAGLGTSAQWRDWLLFTNAVDFGEKDALFHMDVGFYVFRLPFVSFVVDWLFAALVIIFVVTAVAHYVNGGIRFQAQGQRGVTPQVKAHLSVILVFLALLRAVDYYLQRYELTLSRSGYVDGAGYTDVHARLPAISLLAVISLFAVALLLWNIRQRGWTLPVIAVGIWALIAVVAGTIYPAVIQRLRVQPSESSRESDYIARNIVATRSALQLDAVTPHDYELKDQLDPEKVTLARPSIGDAQLLDPNRVRSQFQRLQGTTGYFQFNDLDVDRYTLGGVTTPVVIGARELKADELPSKTWESMHLAYTHGYGVVVAKGNDVVAGGQPDFVVKDLPPTGELDLTHPEIYFGEQLPGYAIVATKRQEISFSTSDNGTKTTSYAGDGGVAMGSFLRRAAFALRFGNLNPLISGLITDQSRILYVRDVRQRVELLAPFLDFDADPYPVVVDGRLLWVLDAYTTTSRFPYAQQAVTDELPAGSGLRHRFNYVRNSVKAVVDAYDGDVKFFVTDEQDPLIRSYRKAFPKLFSPVSDASTELRTHFRYPPDLFNVQTTMWGRYHIDDSQGFYQANDQWAIAKAPGDVPSQQGTTTGTTATTVTGQAANVIRTAGDGIDPNYQLLQLPGSDTVQFVLVRSFVPYVQRAESGEQRGLAAFMTAGSDGEEYGKLALWTMPRQNRPMSPVQVQQAIEQDVAISQRLSLLRQGGSTVSFGQMLLVPIDDSLLYIRPLYVQAEGGGAAEMKQVVVTFRRQSYIADSLAGALEKALSGAVTGEELPTEGSDGSGESGSTTTVPGTSTTSPGTTVPLSADVSELIAQADQLLREANALLTRTPPDLGGYQRKVDEAAQLIQRAAQLSGVTGSSTTVGPVTTTTGAPSGSVPPATTRAPGATTVPTTIPTTTVSPTGTSPAPTTSVVAAATTTAPAGSAQLTTTTATT